MYSIIIVLKTWQLLNVGTKHNSHELRLLSVGNFLADEGIILYIVSKCIHNFETDHSQN